MLLTGYIRHASCQQVAHNKKASPAADMAPGDALGKGLQFTCNRFSFRNLKHTADADGGIGKKHFSQTFAMHTATR